MWKHRSFSLPRSLTARKRAEDLHESHKIRRSSWARVLINTLPSIIFGVFTVIFTIQQNSSSRATREQDRRYSDAHSKRSIFDNYIDIISERLLNPQFNRSNYEHLQTIRVKTLTALRHLDRDYKMEVILFLYENNLIRSTLPEEKRLNLDGADLSNGIEFRRSLTNRCILNYLYLPDVFASNIIFDGCELEGSIFSRSILSQSQFINCSLENSSFIESSLHQTNFHNSDLDKTNFTGAVLTKTTFFDGIFQQVDLTNADLFRSNITNTDLLNFFNTSTANIFANTRFPNGSFSYIDSRQLVKDGGAELECSQNESSPWFNFTIPPRWLKVEKKNESNFSYLPEPIAGKCYFFAKSTSRYYQHLHVKHFSTLIDNGAAWCNFSAYMGCSESYLDNEVYIDLRFINSRNISYSNQSVAMSSHKKGFNFESKIGFIPPYTRVISIRIGATINKTMIKNISQYCVMDEVQAFIFYKNKNLAEVK